MQPRVRPASENDLPRIAEIYNFAVEHSLAVFTETPTTVEERRSWLTARRVAGHPVFVVECDSHVAGFASYTDFRSWPGYRYTVEHSVYIEPSLQGRGLGTLLMNALFVAARAADKHVMVAGVEANNQPSLAFHGRLGFTHSGTLRRVGYKFGNFLDLALLCKTLA
jgi:phosphinothricin acetyltransferase